MLGRWVPSQRAALLALIWLAALAVVVWLLLEARREALERGERSAAAFAALAERQVLITVQATKLTLGAVGDAYQLEPRRAAHNPGFQQLLQRRAAEISFAREISIIGPDGLVTHDTGYPATPLVSLADQPYFLAHRREEVESPSVWPPMRNRSDGKLFMPVTRPLGRSGRFEGVVAAAIHADHFAAQFRELGLPEDCEIALFWLDGTLVASYPASPLQGERLSRLPIFSTRQRRPAGTYWTEQSLLPGERVVSYRLIAGLPLVVHVSRSERKVLAGWRRTAAAAAVVVCAISLFLGWQLLRLARERASRQRAHQQRMQAERLEALGQLAGGIAHDFRNLLNVVSINMGVLRKTGDPGVTRQALAVLERAVAGGMQLTERLLSFARRGPMDIEQVSLGAWLDGARPLLEQAAGPGVDLATNVSRHLPDVLCDSGQLDAALINLVVNARDAMAGAGRVSIQAFACTDEEGLVEAGPGTTARFVCLAMHDSGPGMTPEVRRRAIEPFYSTKGDAGTGLGLSQVYGFMQQLGGNMTLRSQPGEGTLIHLVLPVAPAQA